MSYFYNPRGWLSQINDTSDVPKFAEYLKYTGSGDPGYSNSNFNGLIVATDSYWPQPASGVFDSSSCNYVYDARGWLTQSRTTVALAQPGPADSTVTWTYDDNGNIRSASDRQYAYPAGSNRLTSIYTENPTSYKHAYSYDAVGNCIMRDFHQSQLPYPGTNYNDRNLPVIIYQLQYPQGGKPDTLRFEYDSEGRRVKRELIHWALVGGGGDPDFPEGEGLTLPEDTTASTAEPLLGEEGTMGPIGPPPPPHWERSTSAIYYIWDGDQVIAEYQDTHDNLLGFHFYLGNMQVAGREGQTGIGPNKGRIIYWHNDHLGQPRYQCDSAGNWAAAMAYSAYGQVAMDFRGGTPGLNRGFSNKNTDPGPSGLMDFGARQYDPEIGRFLSVDAAGQFASSYAFAGNAPTIYVDPDGNLFFLATPFLFGFAFGVSSYALPYAMSNDWSRFDPLKALGYGVFGGLAGAASYAVAPQSAILSQAAGSSINSLGGVVLDGRPFSVNLGFGTIGDNGFSLNNPLDGHNNILTGASAVMGWMSASEDLGKVFHGETAEQMQARQLEAKAQSQNPSDASTYLRGDEPDLTVGVDIQKIKAGAYRRGDEPYFDVNNQGERMANLAPEELGHRKDIRFGGRLHLDTRGELTLPGEWRWHYDELGSLWRNPFTMVLHPLFESEPVKWATFLSRAPYQVYRQSYMYWNSRW